jgi:hypothetical protein
VVCRRRASDVSVERQSGVPREGAPAVIVEIDHVLVAVTDPDGVAADLSATLGLLPAGGGVHEAIGTRNALLSLGGPYLELIGLIDDTPATLERALRHPIGAAVVRALGALAAASEGGAATSTAASSPAPCAYVTVALRSDDVARDVVGLAAAAGVGSGIVVSDVARRRPDGSMVRWPVAFPRRLGPEDPPFIIEHAPDEPERAARVAGGGLVLQAVTLAVADPAAVARRWAASWGIAAVAAGASAIRAADDPSRPARVRLEVGPHRFELVAAARTRVPAVVRATDPMGGGRGSASHIADRGGVVFTID